MADPAVTDNVCWFCRNDRHGECIHEIPVTQNTDGSDDCSFGSAKTSCMCGCS